MKILKYILVISVSIIFTACASTINVHNANKHFKVANDATKAGDWDTARRQWAKTLVNAELSDKVSPQNMAIINYEYGRALGVQCFYEKSEEYLIRAYKLDLEINGPSFMDLVELARLNFDQKKFNESIPYFENAIRSLEEVKYDTKAPIGFRDILKEYSIALKNVGSHGKVKMVDSRIKDINSKNTKGYSITDRTPYGTQCFKG